MRGARSGGSRPGPERAPYRRPPTVRHKGARSAQAACRNAPPPGQILDQPNEPFSHDRPDPGSARAVGIAARHEPRQPVRPGPRRRHRTRRFGVRGTSRKRSSATPISRAGADAAGCEKQVVRVSTPPIAAALGYPQPAGNRPVAKRPRTPVGPPDHTAGPDDSGAVLDRPEPAPAAPRPARARVGI